MNIYVYRVKLFLPWLYASRYCVRWGPLRTRQPRRSLGRGKEPEEGSSNRSAANVRGQLRADAIASLRDGGLVTAELQPAGLLTGHYGRRLHCTGTQACNVGIAIGASRNLGGCAVCGVILYSCEILSCFSRSTDTWCKIGRKWKGYAGSSKLQPGLSSHLGARDSESTFAVYIIQISA